MTNKRGNIIGLGNLTGLRPVTNTTTTDTIINYKTDEEDNGDIAIRYQYKTMKISYNIYEKLRDHIHKYHDQPISYDEIFQELLDFYNKEHEKKYFLTKLINYILFSNMKSIEIKRPFLNL